jgi:hypothetical protein
LNKYDLKKKYIIIKIIMFDNIRKYIEYIIDIDKPLISKILISVFVIISFLYIIFKDDINKYIRNTMKWIKEIFNPRNSNKKDNKNKKYYEVIDHTVIKNNDLIIYIDEILNIKLRQYDFGNKKKNKLFIDFVSIPLNLFKKYIVKISENKDLSTLTPREFKKYIMDLIYEYSSEVSTKMKYEFGDDIFDKLNKREFYNDLSNYTIDNIKHILTIRDKDDDNVVTLLAIFALLIFYLKYMFETTTDKYKVINGVLDDVINKRYN